jgi:small-conductance mechanosensitive channel
MGIAKRRAVDVAGTYDESMRDWIETTLGVSADMAYRITATIMVLVFVVVLRWLAARWLAKRVSDPEVLFRARKSVSYLATAIFVVVVSWVWLPFFDDLGTFLGLLSAGIAIALADVFLDIAGWLFIVFRRPFKVGDRIEVDGVAGDVIDVRVFRFTVLEIRNWVDADQSTGRVVHIPNGMLFKHPTANFTEGFYHIWHEVPVLVTFESDWKRAEQLIKQAIEPVAISEEELKRHERIDNDARDYIIVFNQLSTRVFVSTRDSGVLLTARFLVEAKQRRTVQDAVWRSLLELLDAEPAVTLAYPTARAVISDPITIDREDSSRS